MPDFRFFPFLICSVTLFVLWSCGASRSSVDQLPGSFSTSIGVDGSSMDWELSDMMFDDEAKIHYQVANDQNSVSILVKTDDRTQIMKILRNGMEIWMDQKGKKKKSMTVVFPMESSFQGGENRPAIIRSSGGEDDSQFDRGEMLKRLLKNKTIIELQGFREEYNGEQDISGDSGVKAVLNIEDSTTLVTELRIPFGAFKVRDRIESGARKNEVRSQNTLGKNENKEYILVRSEHKIIRLYLNEINYIQSMREYVAYFFDSGKILSLGSLKNLEAELPGDLFMRIHKSYMVAKRKVKALEGNAVHIGNTKLPVGASYREKVREELF